MIRAAVIGLGAWGRQLVRVFAAESELLVACNRGDPEGQAWLRAEYPGVRRATNVAAVFSDPTIDCVAIATPIPTHAPLAIAALESGKDVFVEKPLATSGDEARRVVDAADAAGRRLFVGHTFMYDAGLERLHHILGGDPPTELALRWWKFGTFREPLVWNLLPHEVGLALWLFDRPPESIDVVEAVAGETPLDRLRLALGFAPGGRCEIDIDRVHGERTKSARVETISGRSYLWRDGVLLGPDGRALESAGKAEPAVDEPLVREVRRFIDGLETGRPAPSDGPFGVRVVETIERLGVAVPGVLFDTPVALAR